MSSHCLLLCLSLAFQWCVRRADVFCSGSHACMLIRRSRPSTGIWHVCGYVPRSVHTTGIWDVLFLFLLPKSSCNLLRCQSWFDACACGRGSCDLCQCSHPGRRLRQCAFRDFDARSPADIAHDARLKTQKLFLLCLFRAALVYRDVLFAGDSGNALVICAPRANDGCCQRHCNREVKPQAAGNVAIYIYSSHTMVSIAKRVAGDLERSLADNLQMLTSVKLEERHAKNR